MNSHAMRWIASVAAAGVLVVAGCGDDGDDEASGGSEDETTTTASGGSGDGEAAAYCEASLALETLPEPDVDFQTASEEEIAAAVRTWAQETMRPAADQAIAAAPEELASDLALLEGALQELEQSGDFGAFEQPEVAEAEDRVHQFDLDNCGWRSQAVTATDYAFEGLPEEMEAGTTSFELTNEGDEVHEVLLFRKNEGVTASAEELLALPEEEAMQQIAMIGSPAFAPPGGEDYMVVDLEPGDYIAVCMIPTGMTSEEQPPPADAPPHAMQGMVTEIIVG